MTLFDATRIAFSRRGRFLTLSMLDGALWLRSVRGGDLRPSLGRLARVTFERDGAAVPVRLTLTPGCLTATDTAGGEVRLAIGAGERLHVAGRGGLALALGLQGSRYDYAFRTAQGEDCLVAAYENIRLMPRVVQGAVAVTGAWRRDRADDVTARFSGPAGFEGTVDLFAVTPPPPAADTTAMATADAAQEFAAFRARLAPPRPGADEAHRLAAYVLWANVVPAEGALAAPAVFMSKGTMINIWSWDNAFSALGLAGADDDLAFDQFMAIWARQDPSGMLPDFVHDGGASFAFTKPPVHGWALLLIEEGLPGWITPGRARAIVAHLGAQVRWWLTATRAGPDDLPSYPHGNDSGWDNASFFDRGGPVLSPDLPTFLILCCDLLARLDPAQAAHWQAESAGLCALLLGRLADAQGFGTRRLATPGTLDHGQSLIRFMPLLLGTRLPRPLAQRLVADVAGHLTDWGPATEAPASPFYEADGYWRGPIWAPTTALLWDGLRRQGEHALAREVAARFCRLCETSGMAENFDALTGAPLREQGFAWTAAVYLLLSAMPGAGP